MAEAQWATAERRSARRRAAGRADRAARAAEMGSGLSVMSERMSRAQRSARKSAKMTVRRVMAVLERVRAEWEGVVGGLVDLVPMRILCRWRWAAFIGAR